MPFITQGKTNWKALIVLIILATIVGGGALWYSRRPEQSYQPPKIEKSENIVKDETADWKSYLNENFGFEIKYPTNYYVDPEEKFETIITEKFENNVREIIIAQVTKQDLKDENVTSFDEFLNIGRELFKEKGDFEEIETTVAGNKGTQMTTKDWVDYPTGRQKTTVTFWKVNEDLYIAMGLIYKRDDSEEANFDDFLNLYNKILSTFRIIKVEANTWENYWNTYRSEKYGFEIKYPQDCSPEEKDDGFIVFSIPETITSLEFTVNILKNPNKYSLDKFYSFYSLPENQTIRDKEVGKGVIDISRYTESIETIEVAGVTAKKMQSIGTVMIIAIPHNDRIFEVSGSNEQEEYLDRILSSFRFLD